MNIPKGIKESIPSGPEVAREALIVLGGILIAAWIISRFPAVKKFVGDSSITINDGNGNNLF